MLHSGSVKMSSRFKVNDLVWAKMKNFPVWPGKVIEAKPDVKRPANKKPHHCVFFFGSENYAWVLEENIMSYLEFKKKGIVAKRIQRGYKEAVEAIDDAYSALPHEDRMRDLPTIEDDLAQIFPDRTQVVAPTVGRKKPLLKKTVEKAQARAKAEAEKATEKTTPSIVKKKKTQQEPSGSAKMAKSSAISHKKFFQKEKKAPKTTITYKRPQAAVQPLLDSKLTSLKSMPGSPMRKSLPLKRQAPAPSLISIQRAKKQRFLETMGHSPKKADSTDSSLDNFNSSSSSTEMTGACFTAESEILASRPVIATYTPPVRSLEMEFNVSSTASTQISDSELNHVKPLPSKSIIPTPLRIGFLGLGIMGQGIVMNLLRSGHEVMVWNRTASKCRDFVKDGALKGITPSDVVQRCDLIFSCVSDPTAAKDLVFGNSGVLQGILPGKGYIDMSTVDTETVEDIHEAIVARGGKYLEAPILGSKVPAIEGQLIILAAGNNELFNDCFSCFQAISKKSFFLGEIGSGVRMKLVTQMVIGTIMASLAEGMALAEKVGLDQDDVAEVFSLSSINCPLVIHKGLAILNQRYEPHFPLQHQQKDLRLALSLGDEVEQPLYVASATNELFKKARRLGYAASDMAAVYRAASS